jgi:acetylornithine/succinyldiaminopimelate/putrescine aminotransferase
MDIKQKDKQYLGRSGEPRPLVITKTKGDYVYDDKGRRYIDFYMGWCVGNVGWDVKKINDKIKKFNGPTYISPGYFYKEWADLAEILAKITPGNLVKSFRATGGTEAVEIALQAAMFHTKRHKFISIEDGYHGHSIGAMSVGASSFRKWYKNLLPHCHKIKVPLNQAAGRKVEKLLNKRDVAAFIAEPIICNLGVEIPEKAFYDIVQKACKRTGTLFISDEVAAGFGRTGKMFASEHYNLKPDIMCLAKGITGGYGALGATIMTKQVAKSFEFGFSFYSTFGWQPLNVAAAIANLNYFIENKKQILDNTKKLSTYFKSRLGKMKFRYPAEIRIKGLAIGVRFENDKYAKEIIARCMKSGLLIADATSNDFIIFPSLTIDEKTAKKGLDILESCL